MCRLGKCARILPSLHSRSGSVERRQFTSLPPLATFQYYAPPPFGRRRRWLVVVLGVVEKMSGSHFGGVSGVKEERMIYEIRK